MMRLYCGIMIAILSRKMHLYWGWENQNGLSAMNDRQKDATTGFLVHLNYRSLAGLYEDWSEVTWV